MVIDSDTVCAMVPLVPVTTAIPVSLVAWAVAAGVLLELPSSQLTSNIIESAPAATGMARTRLQIAMDTHSAANRNTNVGIVAFGGRSGGTTLNRAAGAVRAIEAGALMMRVAVPEDETVPGIAHVAPFFIDLFTFLLKSSSQQIIWPCS
jgi:hypothetical protein